MKKLLTTVQNIAFLGVKKGVQASCDTILPPEEVVQLIGTGAILLDVRSKEEVAQGSLKDSICIPHTAIPERIDELVQYREETIIVFCAVGGRATIAGEFLKERGFSRVLNGGGYSDIAKLL